MRKRFRKWVFELIKEFAMLKQSPTKTEKAFTAYSEIEKMEIYLRENNIVNTCSPENHVGFKDIKKYHIEWPGSLVWYALKELKNIKSKTL